MHLLLSIDVEEWFQVENLKEAIHRNTWDHHEKRLEENINRILHLLNLANVKATFFVLGWVAKRLPELIKKIYSHGHEIASHGYSHIASHNLKNESLYLDILKSKNILEEIIQDKILGYRAPNFSITDNLIDILHELNFVYDSSFMNSSIFGRYGKLKNYSVNCDSYFKLKSNLYEIPLSTTKLIYKDFPWAGGYFFRAIPYLIFKKGIERILQSKSVYLFYIHPWEFDLYQPRIKNLKLNYRFRHYYNLDKTGSRFEKLISDFKFSTIKDFLKVKQLI